MTPYELVEQQIVDDTGRPDKAELVNGSSVIMRRVRRAVLAMHRIDFWRKDFIEQEYVFEASGMIQIIDTAFLPRLRAIGYIRKWDSSLQDQYQNNVTGAPKGGAFTEINPEKMLDGYGYDQQDVMYRSGTYIKLNSSIPIDKVIIGWFIDPLLDPITACTSWILQDYPDLITAMVNRRLFKDIGKDEESRSADGTYAEELLRLQTNNVRLAVM
jgi:hypothetical protein